jgi:acyl-CoA thioesterase
MTVHAHDFDADTALEPLPDGRFRAWAPEHWFVARGPNGGFLAALAARAAEQVAGRPLRSLALHFVAPPAVGPLDVAAVVERDGRSYGAVSIRIEQEGRPMTLALATLGELPEDGAGWARGAPPEATPLEETEPLSPGITGTPAFMRNYDMRPALHEDDGHVSGAWMRARTPRALDAPLAVAMTDAWAPVAFTALRRGVIAPTLDLTIHIRRPLPPAGLAPGDHVLARFSSRLAVGGVWEEDGELWSPDGELLVQSRQLALIREPAA